MSKENKEVKISKAKGRPMLSWVGKKPLTKVKAFPAQHIEHFEMDGIDVSDLDWSKWPEKLSKGGLLFHGDNKDVLAYLLANGFRGKVKLIYIDPPFDSGADYVRKVQLRGVAGTTQIGGEDYTIGEQVQYTDIWKNDTYLQFMYERLSLLKELLSDDGCIWMHCDYHKSHFLRLIGEEIFSSQNLVSEVVWRRAAPRGNVKTGFSVAHDTIYCFSKVEAEWHPPTLEYTEEYKDRFNKFDNDGRRYTLDNMISPNPNRPNLEYVWNGVKRVWRVTKEKMEKLESDGRIEYTSNGVARYKRYLDELTGMPLTTIWDDVDPVNSQAMERTDYPTQKPEKLLNRIIQTCTSPNDIVLDCFLGSGTFATSAQKLGRRWIGCDINKGSIQTTAKRLQSVIREQAELNEKAMQADMLAPDENSNKPAQSSFNTYRVNDYDLQVQHNEAVELACEHIGVTRNRADHYFDGSLGNRLVKIIPFNHPLTPLDLEDLREELHRRPEEERDITVVCLGMELSSRGWLEEYNRNRPINKVHVVELRTDQKYGGFIKHEPLVVSINVEKKGDKLLVEVTDVFSPTIIQRLNMEQGVFRATIEDWRSVVDCIMIDTEYDGEIFNVALTDIPAKKQDLVEGSYELSLPRDGSIVAVKVIDMLGEETIITKSL